MAETSVVRRGRRWLPDAEILGWLAALAFLEAAILFWYFATSGGTITRPIVFVYPFLWIDASLLALLAYDPPTGSRRARLVAAAVGLGYFVVLGYFGGLWGFGGEAVPFHVDWALPPGYGPAALYSGPYLRIVLEPFKVIGYLTLTYFVYATVVDATAGAISGIIGLFSCVSCTWPILATIVSSIFGGSSAIAAVALSQSYGLGTVFFLTALALLFYRPLF